MIAEWKKFLENIGAHIEHDTVRHFGKPDAELRAAAGATIMADLSHLGLIRVSGPDAQSFLHNQFTNDVRQVSTQRSQLNAYCSPKGRVLALFRLFQRGADYYLCLPQELVAATMQRLRMFVLRARVTLDDACSRLIHIGLSGPAARTALIDALGAAPHAMDECLQVEYGGGNVTVMRIPNAPQDGGATAYEIAAERGALETLWQALAAHAQPVGAPAWALLNIRSGLPTIYSATKDAFVPQMLNLDVIGAVSFTKGCYPGQEIVARMRYLGTLKRRMVHARVDTHEPPYPGDALYVADNEQSIGQVVDAQSSPLGGFELLAVIQIAHAHSDQVRWRDRQGPVLQFMELPYSLETEQSN
ncbi:MAG: folate-binding protein [Pseudomonadota bacterium]